MPPPSLTADTSLYRPANSYASNYASSSSQGAGPSRLGYPNWGGYTYCDTASAGCVETAETARNVQNHLCTIFPGSYAAKQVCYRGAESRYQTELASCRERFDCGSADCKQSPVAPYAFRCCPPGTQACGTGPVPNCVPECPPRKLIPINASSCGCVCDPLLATCETYYGWGLSGQWVRDPATCLCRCLSDAEKPCTVMGAVRNQQTCVCACPSPLTECSGRCVNLSADRLNCGICGHACLPDEGCCPSNDPDPFSPRGVCTKLNTDENCGSCDTNLQPPWKCCLTPGSTVGTPGGIGTREHCSGCFDACPKWTLRCCPPDSTHTTSYCEPQQSAQRCGVCGQARACIGSERCCSIGGTVAAPVHGCVDVMTSQSHCGACGTRCSSAERCCSGTCRNVQTDPNNCGMCGRVCTAGQCCSGGACATVNLQTDRNNCGMCGRVCPSGQSCCSGNCVNVQADRNNCGMCGRVCPSGQSCCSGNCVNVQTDRSNCGMCGRVCTAGQCCSGGACATVNVQTDRNNCGMCGRACGPGEDCCSGTCINVQTDRNNCGMCGRQCPSGWLNQSGTWTSTCKQGQCVCPDGWGWCGNQCHPLTYPGDGPAICCLPGSGLWSTPYTCGQGNRCCTSLLGCCPL